MIEKSMHQIHSIQIGDTVRITVNHKNHTETFTIKVNDLQYTPSALSIGLLEPYEYSFGAFGYRVPISLNNLDKVNVEILSRA